MENIDPAATKITDCEDINHLLQMWELSLFLLSGNRIKYTDSIIEYRKTLALKIDHSAGKSTIEQIKGDPELLKLKKNVLNYELAIRSGELKIELVKAKYELLKGAGLHEDSRIN